MKKKRKIQQDALEKVNRRNKILKNKKEKRKERLIPPNLNFVMKSRGRGRHPGRVGRMRRLRFQQVSQFLKLPGKMEDQNHFICFSVSGI